MVAEQLKLQKRYIDQYNNVKRILDIRDEGVMSQANHRPILTLNPSELED